LTTTFRDPRLARGEQEPAELPLIVSTDDHVVEPPDLWQRRLPRADAERGPHMRREKVASPQAPDELVWADVWHYEDMQRPVVRFFDASGRPPSEHDSETPILFDEVRPGAYDVAARLRDMDEDGVEVSVCFPNMLPRFCGQLFLFAKDRELALRCVRAYNDFLVEDWIGSSEGRLVASAIVPLWDVHLAAAEVRRNAQRGCTALSFCEIPARLGLPSMYSGYWEPLFEACADTGTVINLHIGSSSGVGKTSDDAPHGVTTANYFANCALSLSDWLMSGAFVRHPAVKINFAEGQAGWAPYLLSRLDSLWYRDGVFAGMRGTLPEPPSTYIRDHVWFSIFDDPMASRLTDVIPIDNLCFETDYPHSDSAWPHSRVAALRQTAELSPGDQRKVLRTNGAELYRIRRVLDAEQARPLSS
jgi:predicted TIM-barrel fold metal-dependent hydrolase